MPFEVTVDHPEAGDQDVYIHGLGTFRNGTTTTVDDDQVMRFRVMNSTQRMSEFDQDGRYTIEQELAPEPHELDIRGVTIKKLGDVPNESAGDEAGGGELDKDTTEQMAADMREAGEEPVVTAPVEVVPPVTGAEQEGGNLL